MFIVKKKPLTPNIIWDSSAGRPLCNFGHKGELKTNDPELAEKLAAMGHTVTGGPDDPAQQPTPGAQPKDNGVPDVDAIASGLADRLQAAFGAISETSTDRQPEETEGVPAQEEPSADTGLPYPESADTVESAEMDTDQQPGQTEEGETAGMPTQQASAAKKRKSRK